MKLSDNDRCEHDECVFKLCSCMDVIVFACSLFCIATTQFSKSCTRFSSAYRRAVYMLCEEEEESGFFFLSVSVSLIKTINENKGIL